MDRRKINSHFLINTQFLSLTLTPRNFHSCCYNVVVVSQYTTKPYITVAMPISEQVSYMYINFVYVLRDKKYPFKHIPLQSKYLNNKE